MAWIPKGGTDTMTHDPKAASWREVLEKTIELGLGAALLTREAVSKVVEDLVKRGAVTREEGKRLVSHMLERGKAQREKMETLIADITERALARADLARRSTVEELQQRVAALEDQLKRARQG